MTATLTLVPLVYQTGFHDYDMGYASAISIVIFVVVMVATLTQLRLSRRWVYYEGGAA